jgi:hypothetical protein
VRQCQRSKIKPFTSEITVVVVSCLTIVDFATDCAMLVRLRNNINDGEDLELIMQLCIVFIALPILVNICLLVRELMSIDMLAFWKFFLTHQLSMSLYVDRTPALYVTPSYAFLSLFCVHSHVLSLTRSYLQRLSSLSGEPFALQHLLFRTARLAHVRCVHVQPAEESHVLSQSRNQYVRSALAIFNTVDCLE